eukprot:TRINITY_DN7256_c0_g1_i1.p1 TRINITY_DN7256_c0_g1~~TRINITY_DN7256_c0_g1_i1.p1  ORF type:complete len:430 (+),score=48.00 TRINITY_DN7256_c0_g1_i1:33-1322(+)
MPSDAGGSPSDDAAAPLPRKPVAAASQLSPFAAPWQPPAVQTPAFAPLPATHAPVVPPVLPFTAPVPTFPVPLGHAPEYYEVEPQMPPFPEADVQALATGWHEPLAGGSPKDDAENAFIPVKSHIYQTIICRDVPELFATCKLVKKIRALDLQVPVLPVDVVADEFSERWNQGARLPRPAPRDTGQKVHLTTVGTDGLVRFLCSETLVFRLPSECPQLWSCYGIDRRNAKVVTPSGEEISLFRTSRNTLLVYTPIGEIELQGLSVKPQRAALAKSVEATKGPFFFMKLTSHEGCYVDLRPIAEHICTLPKDEMLKAMHDYSQAVIDQGIFEAGSSKKEEPLRRAKGDESPFSAKEKQKRFVQLVNVLDAMCVRRTVAASIVAAAVVSVRLAVLEAAGNRDSFKEWDMFGGGVLFNRTVFVPPKAFGSIW